jgi:hypothetical protein
MAEQSKFLGDGRKMGTVFGTSGFTRGRTAMSARSQTFRRPSPLHFRIVDCGAAQAGFFWDCFA